MLAQHKTSAVTGMTLGFFGQLVGILTMWQATSTGGTIIGAGLFLLLTAVFIRGCWRWAQALGYDGVVGLLGVFSIPGLAILLVLPDRHPEPGDEF